MAITNLANTTWCFKSTINKPEWTTVTFRGLYPKAMDALYDVTWTVSESGDDWTLIDTMIPTTPIEIYNSQSGWVADYMKFINFSSGTILTDPEFIAWIKDNAFLTKSGNVTFKSGLTTVTHTMPYTLDTAGKMVKNTIKVDSDILLQEKSVTANGEVFPDTGADGLSSVIVNVPTGTVNNQTKSVQMTTNKGVTVTYDSGYTGLEQVTVTPTIATPAFKGGTLAVDSVSISGSGINAATSTVNNSGIGLSMGAEFEISRSSVLYDGVVGGWVNKSDGVEALPASSSQEQSNIETVYINSVTVPSGKVFSVTNNGTTNINGGLADKGVQVKSNKEVIVDNMASFPVTYSATTTVTVGTTTVTFQAGDLKVPVMSGTDLVFPSGFATPTTTTATVNAQITSINGATIKDSQAVTGSGTTPGSGYFYMPKISSTKVLSDGPKVTISSASPTGGNNGDIWFQEMVL